MDVQSVYDEIQTLPSLILQINKREHSAIAILNRLNRLLFGESVVAGCTNCHIKAYHKLTSLTIKDLEVMNARKFKLNKNITIENPIRSGRFFNDSTMTDEIARDFLLNNPKGVVHFSEYPKDAEGNLQLFEAVEIKEEQPVVESEETESDEVSEEKQTEEVIEEQPVVEEKPKHGKRK